MPELAARLIIAAVLVISLFVGFKTYMAQHDKVRDTEIETAGNVKTEATAVEIDTKAGGVLEDIVGSDAGVQTIQDDFRPKYKELYDASQTVRDAVDTPVPVGLQQLARERWEERERLDCDESGCAEDGGDEPSQRTGFGRWFQSDARAEDDGERIPAGVEP